MSPFENLTSATILEKVDVQLEQKLPFVVYHKPNSEHLVGIFQKNDTLYFVNDYNETGFVFAPFDGDKIVLIPENQSEINIAEFKIDIDSQINTIKKEERTTAKANFEALVQKGIDAIKLGTFSKVVLSRKEEIEFLNFDVSILFQKLANTYPNALSYCFFHPQIGLWLGAFSEQLIKMEGTVFTTMAVAGTQLFIEEKEVVWEDKEKQEQQYVTDFILENLKGMTTEITVSNPYTLRAGGIIHIKTDIKGVLKKENGLREVLAILHPTPAVCGLPKHITKDFILNNEGYNREYYSGFLGEINKNFFNNENNSDLFVNLRCMQIIDNKVFVYVGGGITKDSIPENEWNESVNKAMTIKKVINLG
jgi:isochorismate synthase